MDLKEVTSEAINIMLLITLHFPATPGDQTLRYIYNIVICIIYFMLYFLNASKTIVITADKISIVS